MDIIYNRFSYINLNIGLYIFFCGFRVNANKHQDWKNILQTRGNCYTYLVLIANTVFSFFMVSKVFVHLTHLKWAKISQTYLKLFVWLQNLIKIRLEYYEKQFWVTFYYFIKSGIFHNFSINAQRKLTWKPYDNLLYYQWYHRNGQFLVRIPI